MFPVQDTIPSRSFPLVNWLLILANLAVFVLVQLPLRPRELEALVLGFGVVPLRCTGPLLAGGGGLLAAPGDLLFGCGVPLFTSMFLHGGWLHIISNVWALYIFGDNVEDRMGALRYLLFYLIAGVAAGLVQVAFTPASRVPAIGASGAIAGVLGAYLLLFPRARVITLVPLFILPWFIELPAVLYLAIWFGTQILSGLAALDAPGLGGVAYWAHIGGFAAGLLLVWLFARPAPRRAYRVYRDEYRPW